MATLIPTVIRETAIDADGARRAHSREGRRRRGARRDRPHRFRLRARRLHAMRWPAAAKSRPTQMTRALKLVDGIDSDYEKRNALDRARERAAVRCRAAEARARAGGQDRFSDYERAELLVGMLPQLATADDVRAAWLKAAIGIKSDYEHRRTLSAMLDAGVTSTKTTADAVVGCRRARSARTTSGAAAVIGRAAHARGGQARARICGCEPRRSARSTSVAKHSSR